MTQAFLFDIEKLLAPVSAEFPAGESLRYEGTYDRIREARREDDPSLPQGAWKRELRKAQWQDVESICVQALETRTKDLQIAAWLTEAWLNLQGFVGAAKGLELMRALSESFWDHLHPGIEDGDLEFRMAPVAWLNDKMPVSLKLVPITNPDAPGEKSFCWSDWENASLQENMMQRSGAPKTRPPNKVTVTEFQRSVMLTPTQYFRTLSAEVGELLDARVRLEDLVDAKAGKAAPGLMRFSAVVESIAAFLGALLAQRKEPERVQEIPELPAGSNEFNGDHSESADADPLPVPGRIRDRADAYYLLAEAADYLARIEPHSPTPYLVRRAISWGAMSLEELLPELVRNGGDLAEIFRLLQINKPGAG